MMKFYYDNVTSMEFMKFYYEYMTSDEVWSLACEQHFWVNWLYFCRKLWVWHFRLYFVGLYEALSFDTSPTTSTS